MATTINSIKVDFGLGATPPRVTFLQGADMSISNIRTTIRQIEESEEGRVAPGAVSRAGTGFGWIIKADGNYDYSDIETAALAITILPPFNIFFEPGPAPFQTSLGSLLGTFLDSPGAIVQINNAINALAVETPTSGLTTEESAWLSSVLNIEINIDFLKKSLKGEKKLEKIDNTWYLVIYNTDSPRAEITRKALKDASGNEINDISAGALAQELESSV